MLHPSDSSTFIIAEAGVNHNGSIELAHQMIVVAAKAGVDAIKFQTFLPEELASRQTPKAAYQSSQTAANETQLEMLKNLVLPYECHQALMTHCHQVGIRFLSSPFDEQSIDFLDELGLEIVKIPSGEITNYPYLKRIGRLKKQVIVSTGMSSLEEIGDALAILRHEGTILENITLLHCTTEYPTPYENVNLFAMRTMQSAFPELKVGYSDHTLGIAVSIAAVALGAAVIEKHFTLDTCMPGPDHHASLNPVELKQLVRSIRNIDQSLGSSEKLPGPGESINIASIRKSIVARTAIVENEAFTNDNLTTKRPGKGINPMRWPELIGRKSKKTYAADDAIDPVELE